MVKAGLGNLETGRQIENLLAVLDGRHAPGGEGLAVARPLDLIEHRRLGIARADEIAVQGVAGQVRHGLVGGDQRLADHLAAENPPAG